MDDISIASSTRDEIQDTDSFIYNPSFMSSGTSIASYKTERTVNSRKSRYNALPRHKYAGIGLSNGLASSGVDVLKAVSGQRPRESIPHVDGVPSQAAVQNPILIDSEASVETRRQLCTELKPKIITLVEYMYNFNTSKAPARIIHNTRRAEELLRDMNFIYPKPQTGRDPYSHPIIQRVIDSTWFRDKDDIGVVEHEHFSLMPIPIIAITLTAIEWCIGEWSGGTRRDSSWDDAKFQTVYDSHVSSLLELPTLGPASLYQLQCDLSRNAREYAGVVESTDDAQVIEDKLIFAREEPGDRWLHDARKLARENEALISPSDLEIVNERIALAAKIQLGLESKRALPRYLQIREYRKATKEILKFVKTVLSQVRPATPGQNSAFPGRDTVSVQRPRRLVHHIDPWLAKHPDGKRASRDSLHRWLSGGLGKSVELSATGAPPAVEAHALERTLMALVGDQEIEDFVARVPGFFDSHAVPDLTSAILPLMSDHPTTNPILGSRLHHLLKTCIAGTSPLNEENRQKRLRVCLKSLWYFGKAYDQQKALESLPSYFRVTFASPEMIHRIQTEQDLVARVIGRCFGTLVAKKLSADIDSCRVQGNSGMLACLSAILGIEGQEVWSLLGQPGAIELASVISLMLVDADTLDGDATPSDVLDVFKQTLQILSQTLLSQDLADLLLPQLIQFHEIYSKASD